MDAQPYRENGQPKGNVLPKNAPKPSPALPPPWRNSGGICKGVEIDPVSPGGRAERMNEMKTYTEAELNEVLRNHKHWLLQDCDGWEKMRADLSGADLSGAYLRRAKTPPFIPMVCPDYGEFTAWKKASGKIVKLLIPEDARRSSATGRKCRCDKAVVLSIQNLDGSDAGVESVPSGRDKDFIYKIGGTVTVPDFCEDRFEECAAGIHFFINRQEAVEYNG